jgi:hypothetical protein
MHLPAAPLLTGVFRLIVHWKSTFISGSSCIGQFWLYHHLKDIGDNVIIDFADAAKTGDFKMTKDPNPKGGTFIRRP